jgi:cell pole-organizing protein PopZ
MRSIHVLPAALVALSLCAACGSTQQSASNAANTAPAPAQNRAQTVAVPPVASAHGDNAVAPAAPAAPASADKPSLATPELDAKIEKAEAKAKAAGASDADKKAAAAAYVERANVYYTAQQPSLYKFALGDFRRALRYDPANEDARGKLDQIVSIYQSMGRPVPTNGLDQQ